MTGSSRIASSVALATAVALLSLPCGRLLAAEEAADAVPPIKTELLPEIAVGDAKFSDYAPTRPYALARPGLLQRSLFKGQGSAGVAVEVLDLLVPTSEKPVALGLTGPAVVQVRGGHGVLRERGKSTELDTGATFVASPGVEGATVENTASTPMVLRATVFTGR